MNAAMTGGCQCGRVRYAVTGADDAAYWCHCRMCQRATGGVAAALKQVARAAVTWTIRPPDRYRSSPIASRGFCSACGTPLTYEGDEADDLDLTVGSFDDPGLFRPVLQTGVESRHDAWLDPRDLPATRTGDNAAIAAKWMKACGKLPD